jgi:hypothetical protein
VSAIRQHNVQTHQFVLNGENPPLAPISVVLFADRFVERLREQVVNHSVMSVSVCSAMVVCQCFLHEVRDAPAPLLSNEVWILAAKKVSAMECNQAKECGFILVVTKTCDLLNSLFVSH